MLLLKIIILFIISTISFLYIKSKIQQSRDITFNNNIEGINYTVLLKVGQKISDYKIPAILDGLASYKDDNDNDNIIILINHELKTKRDNYYKVKINNNDTKEKIGGARITRLIFNLKTKKITNAKLAYDRIIFFNKNKENKNLYRFCSSSIYDFSSQSGDLVYFCGEETMDEHGRGFALDVKSKILYEVEAFGKHSFENIIFFPTQYHNLAVALIGDDRKDVPLFLYIGKINCDSTDFLDRNGLKNGKIYAWVPSNDFYEKEHKTMKGCFKEYVETNKNKFHRFQRIEDLAYYQTCNNKEELIFNSTTGGKNGRIFHISINLENYSKNIIKGEITNIYDCYNELQKGGIDTTITMPDNIHIDNNKNIYIQEDKLLMSLISYNKIWKFNLDNNLKIINNPIKIATLDKIGETSGIIEVTQYFNDHYQYFLITTQIFNGNGELILFWF